MTKLYLSIYKVIAEVLKSAGHITAVWLNASITQVWESEADPADWKKAVIVPVFKSGDASVLDNYHGISLLSIAGKVYSMIIGNILKAWIDTNLLDVQCGFRTNRGCNDAIFGLRRIHEEAIRCHCNLYTCFIDLSTAYDLINRGLAWKVFELRGVPSKLIGLQRDLHTDTQCALKGDHKSHQKLV